MSSHHQPDLFAAAFGNEDPRVRLEQDRQRERSMLAANKSKVTKAASYGTDPKKLARRGAPSTSRAAADGVNTTKLEAMVHRAIHSYGDHGVIACTLTDVRFKDRAYSSITARFSALEKKGYISCGPDKRPGASGRLQRVMRSIRAPEGEE